MIKFDATEFRDWLCKQDGGFSIMTKLSLTDMDNLHPIMVRFARVMEDQYEQFETEAAAMRERIRTVGIVEAVRLNTMETQERLARKETA